MADNTRVSNAFGDIAHGQLAQSGRTQFTPGKATSGAGDQNWPKDFKIPTGNPNFETGGDAAEVRRQRVFQTGRNIVCDQTVDAPVTTVQEEGGEMGAGYSGTHSFTGTETQHNDGRHEDKAGHDYLNE